VTGRPKPSFRLARPLFIREASASFAHTHQLALQCASLGGEPIEVRCDIKEGSWSMSLYLLVK
jgi:hypothetical protein